MRETEADVVIVGSGAGGGTVALGLAPLAEAGARVVVLEAGPRVPPAARTGRELEMARRLYVDAGGMLTRDRSLTLAMGRAYGGSTLVYTGVSLVPEREVVAGWGVPGLDPEDVLARAGRAAAMLEVHELPEELHNPNNRAFARGCRELGWRLRRIPLAVRECRGAGVCNLGCPHDAKLGTHNVHLPEAERRGVEVVTGCRAVRVGEGWVEAVVSGSPWAGPPPWEEGAWRIRARAVVVAAGAVGSPALLLASGLGRRLPWLGRGLALHPALILVADHEEAMEGFWGHPKSWYTDEFVASHRYLLEVCMYYPFTTARNLIGFGAEHAEAMGRMRHMQQVLVLALDRAREENRVRVGRDGEAVVEYRLAREVLDAFHHAMLSTARLFFAAGARRVHAPAGRPFWVERGDLGGLEAAIPRERVRPGRISVSSAHPMGGCRMGTGPEDSVTDAWGRVHGVAGLYVADSGLFPASPEVNPALTVMALADRVAEAVRRDLGAWGSRGAGVRE